MSLYQATTNYFCAGFETDIDGKVIDAAPIMLAHGPADVMEFIAWVRAARAAM